jgi:AhpD family alkylhydroperoxidase
MEHGFDRKVFSAAIFWKDLGFLFANAPGIVAAMRNPALGHAFMEKTMIVVTAINGCTYCSWFHAKQAVSGGMSDEEVRDMVNMQFAAAANEHELPALLFAQHYAETDRNPDPDMTKRLNEFYGEETAYHIMLFIRMIFFGNLFGNTFDAFFSRLHGKKAENSSVWFETMFFLLTAWFMLPMKWLMYRQERARENPAH